MERISPSGPVYQAGTLSGNPVAMAAGLASLARLHDPSFYRTLETSTQHLAAGLRSAAVEAGIPVTVNACNGMLTLFFSEVPVTTLAGAQSCDTDRYARFSMPCSIAAFTCRPRNLKHGCYHHNTL
jgi:glutamate-1-semialdehyde 2,1-aminomutase